MRSLGVDEHISNSGNWRAALELLPYLWVYRTRTIAALILLVGAKLAGVGMPVVLKYIVDALDTSQTKMMLAVPFGLLLAYGLLRFCNVLFAELRDALFSRVSERIIRHMGLDIFRHLHDLDISFHLDRKTGSLSRDIERGTRAVSYLLRFMIFSIIPTLLEVAMVISILLYSYEVAFSLIGVVSIALYIGFSVVVTNWRTHLVRASNVMDNQANARAIDTLLNYETVKYFGNEAHEAQLYDETLQRWEKAKLKTRLSLSFLNSGQAFIIAAGVTGMMTLAAINVVDGSITLGDLVMVNAFMLQLFIPLGMLGFIYREMKDSLVHIERYFSLKDVVPKIVDSEGATQLLPGPLEIEFSHVSFSYRPDRQILQDISFCVNPGETVALVGASGGGKSTIARLLFRFYDVEKGAVSVGGQDVRTLTQASLRSVIGVVPQDTVLFNDSIYNNIAYGRPNASSEEVERVIELAHLKDFIDQLPDGYDTAVGERGLKLSGGEKQRVAIARVLLKQPSILIFDEATSSLDSQSEKFIIDAVAEITQNVTTLVIAHRLATVVNADRILVLEQGKVIEAGDHHSLLQANGVYGQMWSLQQKEQE